VESKDQKSDPSSAVPFCFETETKGDDRNQKLRLSHLLCLFIGLSCLHLLGNWILPLIDRDEPRFAEASREMRQSHDLIVPRLNGDYRFDKPPLIYWCQVLSYDLFGDNDFAARFPSVLFAAATACLIACWGARLFNPNYGLWAGLLFGTTLQVFIHARAAVADMPMVFFFTATVWIGWLRLEQPKKQLWALYYLSLALGFLAKGPVALLPILVPPIYTNLYRRIYPTLSNSLSAQTTTTPSHSKTAETAASAIGGFLLMLVVIGAWGIPALILTHGEFFWVGLGKHVVERSIAPMESHGAKGIGGYLLFLPFYFLSVLVSFFPWSLYFGKTTASLRKQREPIDIYLLLHIGLVFLLFTLIRTKLPHYILPAFPLMTLLMVRHIGSKLKPLAIGACVVYTAISLVGFSLVAPLFPSKTIFEKVENDLTPEMRTASLGYDEQSLIWYLRTVTKPFHQRIEPAAFDPWMRAPGPAICVVNRERLAQIKIDPSWKTIEVHGRNIARWQIRKIKFFGKEIALPTPQPLDLIVVIKGSRKTSSF
jgi:hypothetical protein